MSKGDVLLAIHNFSELKSLANNAKIRSLLKFLLIQYLTRGGLPITQISPGLEEGEMEERDEHIYNMIYERLKDK